MPDQKSTEAAYEPVQIDQLEQPAVNEMAEEQINRLNGRRWRQLATRIIIGFFVLFAGYLVYQNLPVEKIWAALKEWPENRDPHFFWMIAAGFAAQLVDGALGMGYGVTTTICLLSLGINLPAISGSIHTAEMFSSGVSGYSHYKFGNVNKKLFKVLLIPGIIGAVGGALLLWKLGERYVDYIRPILAAYTLILGVRIITNAFKKKKAPKKVKHAGWLAGAGGFLDSFGGGGWGPLVTSTLIAKGRTPRFVIGTVSLTEFFVTLSSALTFFGVLGISHWQIIAGLIIGGVVASPIAARLSGKLPMKSMFIGVGALVIIWSLRILGKAIGLF